MSAPLSALNARPAAADGALANAPPPGGEAAPRSRRPATARRIARLELLLVLALHAAGLAALFAFEVVTFPAPIAALTVRMIAAEAPPAAVTPPRPKRARQQPPQPAPVVERLPPALTTPTAASTPVATISSPAPVVATPAPTREAAVAPVSEPRFDAAYLDNPAPVYPAMAQRLGEQGKVVLHVFVEAAGRASRIEVKDGSGSPRLDQAAVDAVWRWQFIPARRGAEAVGAWVVVPIAFNLKG